MVGQELKTITPNMRHAGIFNIRGGGEDLPKQPPAIVSPGSIKRVTRARGEDTSIPQVEIYVDDQGAAGQESSAERLVTKAQREAKKRVGTRKEVIQAEKEILERKVAKQIKKEEIIEEKTPSGVVKKIIKEKVEVPISHAVPALMDIDRKVEVPALTDKERKEIKARKIEAKAKIAEAEAKKAQAEVIGEMYKNMSYLQYVNKRAKELQKEKGVGWKEAKSDATDEWKEHKKPAGYLTEVSISSADEVRGKKGKKSESEASFESLGPIKVSKKPAVKVETVEEGGSAPRVISKEKIKDGFKKHKEKSVEEENAKKQAEYEKKMKKYEKQKIEEAKKRREARKEAGLSQRQILEFIEGLAESDLEGEYRKIHPRKALPSAKVMKNTLIKHAGGEIYGGKRTFGTSEESST
jgi:hypothetical protein